VIAAQFVGQWFADPIRVFQQRSNQEPGDDRSNGQRLPGRA